MKIATFFLLALTTSFANAQQADGADSCSSDLKLLPVLWQQRSAEYRALCYQAFNIAEWRLNNIKLRRKINYAIITDVDETILDNSYYEVKGINDNREFEIRSWHEWTSAAKATEVPGSVAFLQYAKKKGVEIFYISNRDTSEVESTITNLKNLKFPDADASHMLFLKKTSSKEQRRQAVLKNHKVIMFLGDNLNDFARVFEKQATENRLMQTDSLKQEWGKLFIVLPNATYGEWENALYEYSKTLTPQQKRATLRRSLVNDPK